MTLLLSVLMSALLMLAISAECLHIRLSEKNITSIKQNDSLFYTLERKMEYLMKESNLMTCLVPKADPNAYLQRLQEKSLSGCPEYVIEDLGIVGCIFIKQQEKRRAAHLYRMTIFGENKQNTLLLQSVFSRAEATAFEPCANQPNMAVPEGKLSWRIASMMLL